MTEEFRVREGNHSAWERWAILLWIGGFLGIAIHIAVSSDPRRGNVYLKVYALAAHNFVHGLPLFGSGSGFRYPPIAAAMFVPFAVCGPILGSVLWRALNFLVLWAGARAVARAGFPFVLNGAEKGIFLIMLAVYNNTSLNNGQANPVILGLLLMATAASVRRADRVNSLALACSTALKVYPLVYGMVLAALRPRLLIWLVPAIAVVVLLPFALQSPDYVLREYTSLVQVLTDDERSQQLSNAYRDLRLVSVASGWTMSNTLFHILGAGFGAGIVILCLLIRRSGASKHRVLDYAFSLTMCWIIVFGPATERSTFSFVSATLVWPLISAWRTRARGWLAVWGAVNILFLVGHLPLPLSRGTEVAHPWLRCLHTYAVLLASVGLVARAVVDWRGAGGGTSVDEVAASFD